MPHDEVDQHITQPHLVHELAYCVSKYDWYVSSMVQNTDHNDAWQNTRTETSMEKKLQVPIDEDDVIKRRQNSIIKLL